MHEARGQQAPKGSAAEVCASRVSCSRCHDAQQRMLGACLAGELVQLAKQAPVGGLELCLGQQLGGRTRPDQPALYWLSVGPCEELSAAECFEADLSMISCSSSWLGGGADWCGTSASASAILRYTPETLRRVDAAPLSH